MKRSYRIEKIFIAATYFVLLYWIFYVLVESGQMSLGNVLWHFVGISLYGAVLIVFTAHWDRYHHFKGLRKKRKNRHAPR